MPDVRLPDVCVGVHVHAAPDALARTLEHLRAYTPATVPLVLLPDGPDDAIAAMVAGLNVPVLGTPEPRGGAACFNRLAGATTADVVILLESGSLVGPGWLDRLCAAMALEHRNGLAGPSTNMAWNEQCVFPHAQSSWADVAACARRAAALFAGAVRGTEPLHSLADFCYAARRDVIEAVGAADEEYGLGPCWEIDYTTRASRAGYRGVWACSAYVHRLPFTARRTREESLRFEASRQRFQDKFCGLRLRGERTGDTYEAHCRGDACEHFAPRAATASLVEVAAGRPLVSCVMPTRNRAAFVRRSVDLFDRQDYPERELIVVDDQGPWTADLARSLHGDSRIRYVTVPPGMSIGQKRNIACEQARGTIIAQWDDDDWFGPRRLTVQVEPIHSGRADVTGLTAAVFRDQEKDEWWTCSPAIHRRMFEGDVHGGTLVFARRIWSDLARYPNSSLAEDAMLLRQARQRGARLQQIDGRGHFIYVRHRGNTWRFACGTYLDSRGWQRVSAPELSPEDRGFFQPDAPACGPELPLVSCIMPTADRRAWVPYAIDYFLRQDYPRRELVIVDDGTDGIQDLVPTDERIRYVRLPFRRILGDKRNICVEHSTGDLVMHWDDDDWMAANRISVQVAALRQGGGEVSGLRSLLHQELGVGTNRTWLYAYPAHLRAWVLGNTLVYTREFWQRSPFPRIQAGEDARFLFDRPLDHLVVLPESTLDLYVAIVHAQNTSPKQRSGAFWTPWLGDIRQVFGQDAGRYIAAPGSA
jgi:glycosyltransferase involved in cell wall biosynthesis